MLMSIKKTILISSILFFLIHKIAYIAEIKFGMLLAIIFTKLWRFYIMQKNAIVLMFDSLQFNYLGCYGNTWIKTPNMDRLAREGVLFENSYCLRLAWNWCSP